MTFKIIALSVFALLWSAYFVIRLRESGIRPLRSVLDGLGRIRPVTRLLVLLTVGHLTFFAGGKHGGTNDVQGGGAPLMMRPPVRTAVPVPNFTLASVGTDETFDFTPPETAVVATNWLLHGASTQPLRLICDDWVFPFGKEGYSNFTVFASGEVMPGEITTNCFLKPFAASLGIVPAANWHLLPTNSNPNNLTIEQSNNSLFWSAFSPSNTLLLTWQNALLEREATNPVSFQAELKPSGGFTFRYDLSRLVSDELLTNVVIAVRNGEAASSPLLEDGIVDFLTSGGDAASPLSLTNLSSLTFQTLNERTCDENREIFAEKIGSEDPYAYPEGSTNTVLEHVFYSGTTNGPFAYPQSTDGNAVLMVSVSGHGSGELMVGSKFVPLVGRPAPVSAPRLFAAPPPSPSTLAVSVPRGSTQKVYMRGDSTLSVSFDSDDFAFGEMPDLSGRHFGGWINFPFVNATVPCIHDYNARKKVVSLPVGSGASELTCRWTGTSQIGVENLPPRSATITGHFSGRTTTPVSYTLDHPRYLFGQKTYSQTARYCPPPPEEDEDEEDHHGWGGSGYYDGEGENDPYYDDHEDDDWWEYDEDDDTEPDPDPEEGDDEEASDDYPHVADVLKIRDPLEFTAPIHLTVPDEHRNCCPCPDHASNWVAVVYQSSRIKVIESDSGLDFVRSGESLDVQVAGVAPSSAIGDAELSIAANGDVCFEGKYTVLGVGIEKDEVDLALLNWISPDFGLPIPVTTNMSELTDLDLKTLVRLPGGNIHVGLANVTGEFTVRYYDPTVDDYRVLVDSSNPSLDVSYERWRRMVGGSTDVYSSETPVYVTSSAAGSATLVYRYWGVIDGMYVEDEARQVISSIDPPLMADVNRDGEIDGLDGMRQIAQNPFRFWYNSDVVKGDCLGPVSDSSPNADDLKVNGKFDLVNLFPLQVDVTRFQEAWGRAATFRLRARTQNLRFCVLGEDISAHVAQMQTRTVQTVGGECLERASLTPLDYAGTNLVDVLPSGAYSAVLAFEAKEQVHEWESPELVISLDDREVFTYRIPLSITSVDEMYRWLNVRGWSGETVVDVSRMDEPENLPYAECSGRNLIFLHGANVSQEDARKWADVIFKRMWWSGSRARFVGVTWRSDIGAAWNYHENASNAFEVARMLTPQLVNIPGEKIVMAHSLGNMVVSSMIQDYGFVPETFLMCNSAVPVEAYDQFATQDSALIHGDWEDYPSRTYAREWYRCFPSSDDRSKLTWVNRFGDVAQYAVNFYSSGDHVLELYDDNSIGFLDGYENWDQMFERYSWHKQELWKGRRSVLNRFGTTSWAGWGFSTGWGGLLRCYTAEEAAALDPAGLSTNTVFNLYPESMNTNVISRLVLDAHLTQGIPTLTPAAGRSVWGPEAKQEDMINLNDLSDLPRPNGWPSYKNWGSRWLHSDIKDKAYWYVFKFYQKAVEEGEL